MPVPPTLKVISDTQKRIQRKGWQKNVLAATSKTFYVPDEPGFEPDDSSDPERPFELPPEGVDFEMVEKSLLLQALERSNGNQIHAAKLLKIGRSALRYRMRKFQIPCVDVRKQTKGEP